jgi:hypothetical protein
MGMSTDELADSLVKAQQLEALGGSEKRLLDEKLTALKKAGDFEKASQLEKLALQGKGVELAALEVDTQAQIDKSVSSIKESLKSGVAPLLGGITEKLAKVLADMAANPIMKAVLGGLGMVGAGAALAASAAAAVMAIKNILVGSAIERKQLKELQGINQNTAGGGGITGAATPDEGNTSGTGKPRGGIGSSLKRAGTAFKRGGLGAGMKSMGRMAKSGIGGLAKGGLKGIGKGLLKRVPMIGALMGAGMEFADGGFNMESLCRAALSGGGSFLGGLAGSAVAPGVGTVLGGVGGGIAGDKLGDYFFGKKEEKPEEKPEEMQDFILRPGQKPLKFRKDDVVMGGTNLTGNSTGGSSSTGGGNIEALLKELIAAVKEGGNISIGANKLNEAIGINLHPMR